MEYQQKKDQIFAVCSLKETTINVHQQINNNKKLDQGDALDLMEQH